MFGLAGTSPALLQSVDGGAVGRGGVSWLLVWSVAPRLQIAWIAVLPQLIH